MCARGRDGRDGKSILVQAATGETGTGMKIPEKSETPFVASKGATQVTNTSSGLGNTASTNTKRKSLTASDNYQG